MTLGRLTLGRAVGESIQIGDDLRITVARAASGFCSLEINKAGRTRVINLGPSDELRFDNDISVWVIRPPGMGSRPRVTIQAPKDVAIMRTELLDESSRSPGPVSRTGSPVTP